MLAPHLLIEEWDVSAGVAEFTYRGERKKRGDNAFGATRAQPLSRVSTISIGFRGAKIKAMRHFIMPLPTSAPRAEGPGACGSSIWYFDRGASRTYRF